MHLQKTHGTTGCNDYKAQEDGKHSDIGHVPAPEIPAADPRVAVKLHLEAGGMLSCADAPEGLCLGCCAEHARAFRIITKQWRNCSPGQVARGQEHTTQRVHHPREAGSKADAVNVMADVDACCVSRYL